LLEKTASNCFRLGYVTGVFPDAKIIYPVRDGRNTVNSMINAWRHPERFFTYDVPMELHIEGYVHGRWKFVLPPGWRDYTRRSLAEVCAFQWRSCHEFMLAETAKEQYRDRVLRIRLEEFPVSWTCLTMTILNELPGNCLSSILRTVTYRGTNGGVRIWSLSNR
jgi:hypothetical protein